MYKDIEVDTNLYYLSEILLNLKYRKFDSDITKILNDLYNLVEEKIWSNINLSGYDITEQKIIIRLSLEK